MRNYLFKSQDVCGWQIIRYSAPYCVLWLWGDNIFAFASNPHRVRKGWRFWHTMYTIIWLLHLRIAIINFYWWSFRHKCQEVFKTVSKLNSTEIYSTQTQSHSVSVWNKMPWLGLLEMVFAFEDAQGRVIPIPLCLYRYTENRYCYSLQEFISNRYQLCCLGFKSNQ